MKLNLILFIIGLCHPSVLFGDNESIDLIQKSRVLLSLFLLGEFIS